MRTLYKNRGPCSSSMTRLCGYVSAHVIAPKNPAAPPPTTITRMCVIFTQFNSGGHGAEHHVPQRRTDPEPLVRCLVVVQHVILAEEFAIAPAHGDVMRGI